MSNLRKEIDAFLHVISFFAIFFTRYLMKLEQEKGKKMKMKMKIFKNFVKTVLFMMAMAAIILASKGTAFAQDLKVRQCDEWRCESILESSKRILSYEDSYYILMDQYIRFSEDGESYIWYMKVYNKDLNTIEEYVDELEFVDVGRISDILAYH